MDPLKVLSNQTGLVGGGGGDSLPMAVRGPHWHGAVSTVTRVLMNTRQFSGPALASERDELFSGTAW